MYDVIDACMGTHVYGQIPLSNSLSAWLINLFDTNTPCDTKNSGAQPQTPRKRHLLPRPFIKILDTPLSEFLRPPLCKNRRRCGHLPQPLCKSPVEHEGRDGIMGTSHLIMITQALLTFYYPTGPLVSL